VSGDVDLLLASRSPQRRAILDQLCVRYAVRPTDAIETTEGPAESVANENATRKALAAAALGVDTPVLGVDTVVSVDGLAYGKPADADAARDMLRMLSGRAHQVVSGLALVRDGEVSSATAVTEVIFRTLDARRVDWYVATGEWRERAGGYAIQARGAALVRAIDGDYLNVVGLPVATLLDLAPGLVGW
jgi:septum formation protein